MKVLMYALAASCEELRARTGNPPLEMYLGRKRDSILLVTSSRIRICQEEKIADNIASVNQA
jgi:hypothetical protein